MSHRELAAKSATGFALNNMHLPKWHAKENLAAAARFTSHLIHAEFANR